MIPQPNARSVAPVRGRTATRSVLARLDLDDLRAGDKLIIKTHNSTYQFAMVRNRQGVLATSKKDTGVGFVKLEGGLDADATEYYPDRVVIGGRLAYSLNNGAKTVATSAITEIELERMA